VVDMSESPFTSKHSLKLFIIESLEAITNLLKAIDHPTRLEILTRLLPEDKELKELSDELKIQKTLVANHVSQLMDCGLVEKLERGIYRITFDGLDLLEANAKVFLSMKIREHERLEAQRRRYQTMISRYTNLGKLFETKE
jgi:DNA-binding transcriptional ArsR family regulator